MSCCHPPTSVRDGRCSLSSLESFEHPANLKRSKIECAEYTCSVVVRCVFVLSCKCPQFVCYSFVGCPLCLVNICYLCASSIQDSVCVRLIELYCDPFYVRCKYVPVCPSPKHDGMVISPPDTIFLYMAMYVDPLWLSVTGA